MKRFARILAVLLFAVAAIEIVGMLRLIFTTDDSVGAKAATFALMVLTAAIPAALGRWLWKAGKSAPQAEEKKFAPPPTKIDPPHKERPAESAPQTGSLRNELPLPGGKKYMSGQLVALYKRTGDESYQREYLRRLRTIGFTAQEADAMFRYELAILKEDKLDMLCNENYIMGFYFDLKQQLLPEGKQAYIDRQEFLCSEITKIWDEAEWHYHNSHEQEMPDAVWTEIYKLTRYGGGELFVEYLTSMAEHAGLGVNKLQIYSAAEQQLIFYNKWDPKSNRKDPYPG